MVAYHQAEPMQLATPHGDDTGASNAETPMTLVTVRQEKLASLTGLDSLTQYMDRGGEPVTLMAGFKVCPLDWHHSPLSILSLITVLHTRRAPGVLLALHRSRQQC